jgi:diaminopimelate epimerase
MQELQFTKMVAAGNDFLVIDMRQASCVRRYALLAEEMCERKFGAGADGLLVIERSTRADLRMRIFNPDGSEAEMCGNGARCVANLVNRQHTTQNAQLRIETKAGVLESLVCGNNVRIKLSDPEDIRLNIPLRINQRTLKVNFINSGVPHVVIFVEGLGKIDVAALGSQVRYHPKFSPAGTNADFVEVTNDDSIRVRTYERGVEDETLACGTGSVAAALITAISFQQSASNKIKVATKSGEILKVYFQRSGNNFKNVWLEGKVNRVYKGVWYV